MSAHEPGGQNISSVGKEERRLIRYMRELNYGEIRLEIKNGKPVMIRKERADIKLTD